MKPRTRSRIAGVTILTLWAIVMGWLVIAEMTSHDRDRAAPQLRLREESWVGVFSGDERLGVVHITSAPEVRRNLNGRALRLDGDVAIRAFDDLQEIHLAGRLWRADHRPLVEITATLDVAGHSFSLAAVGRDDELAGTIKSGGTATPFRLPWDSSSLHADLAPGVGDLARLDPGDELSIDSPAFLPLSSGTVLVRCLRFDDTESSGVATRARVLAVSMHGLEATVWIDDSGRVLRADTSLGLGLRALTRQEATASSSPEVTADLVKELVVAPTGTPPHRGARSMVARITSNGAPATLPTDDTQVALGDGRYRIRTTEPNFEPPPRAAPTEYLSADILVQSRDPKIVATARDIVGDETGPWEKALRLYEWVFVKIEKKSVVGVPSALDVLSTREGDCNEHTVLFTALARASSIPTRVALGLVWSDELGAFGYHAWPEVFVGRWVWMDPTLGQPVADATHVKLLDGPPEAWPGILGFIGRTTLEVTEIE